MTGSQAKPPDGGWGWVIAVCSFLNHVFLLGSITSFSVLYVSWLEDFGMAKSATSWVISICTSVMFLSGPVSSALASRLGYRLTTLVGVLACCGLVLSSMAASLFHLVVSIGLITGFGYGLAYLSSLANVVIYFDKRRAMATCIGTSGAGVGSFVMAPLLNALTETFGWRGAVLITGGLVLHICVTGMLMRPLAPDNKDGDEMGCPRNNSATWTQESCRPTGEENEKEKASETKKGEAELFMMWNPEDEYQIEKAPNEIVKSLQIENWKYLSKDHHEVPQSGSTELDTLYPCIQQPSDSDEDGPDKPLVTLHKPITAQRVDAIELDLKTTSANTNINKPDRNSQSNTPLVTTTTTTTTTSSSSSIISFHSRKRQSNENFQCCDKSMARLKHNLKSIFHKNKAVVKEPAFAFLATSQVLVCMSSIAPIVFLVDRAIHNHIAKSSAVWLISVYGIGSISGRLFFGMLADKYLTNRLVTYIAILTVGGIATILSPLCGGNFFWNAVYAGFFGFCMGGVASLVILVIVDIMGLTKVAVTLGLLLFCAGLGHFAGPPIGGFVYDLTDSYTLSYVCQGIFLTMSGGVLLPICCKQRRRPDNTIPEPLENAIPEPSENVIPEPSENVIPEPLKNAITGPPENAIPEPPENAITEPPENAIPDPPENAIPEPPENVIPEPSGSR